MHELLEKNESGSDVSPKSKTEKPKKAPVRQTFCSIFLFIYFIFQVKKEPGATTKKETVKKEPKKELSKKSLKKVQNDQNQM